jgi:hypothetical protein
MKDKIIANNNNLQNGGAVPQAFKDAAGTVKNNDAFSGAVWQLAGGQAIC